MPAIDPGHEAAMLGLCERFLAAVVAGDIETVRSLYAPEAVIWHNNQPEPESVEENLRTLALAVKVVAGFRYENVRRMATVDGFIEQHVVRGLTPSGEELSIPACLIATVHDGRITRIDEYIDSAHLAPLLAP